MDARTLTDEQLYESACAGDSEAFGVLYTRYFTRVVAKCARLADGTTEAADLAHEVFAEALVRIRAGSDSPRGEFGGWLVGAVTSYVLTCHRRSWWTQAKAVDAARDAEREQLRNGPSRPSASSMLAGELAQSLATLTDKQRLTVQLYYLDGLSTVQIAERIGRHVRSVAEVRARAVSQLRERLAVAAGTAVAA